VLQVAIVPWRAAIGIPLAQEHKGDVFVQGKPLGERDSGGEGRIGTALPSDGGRSVV
jgi:hypothetical protein